MSSGMIILFVVLLVFSGFFASSEIALMSVPSHLVETFVKQKRTGATKLQWIKDRTDILLITILIGNNLVNTLIAALATKIALDIARISSFEESLAIGVATTCTTIVLLILGDMIPKRMASRNPADFALTVAPINYLLIQALYPVTRCIDKTIRMFATSDKGNALRYVSADEIEALVDMGRQQTTIEEDMAKHIKKMIAFHDTTVQEIITPRVRIEAIKASATVSEAMLKMKEYSHSRIPVFSKRIDDIEWIVSHRELSMYLEQGLQDRTLAELPLKKALKIPLTMPIDKVIDVFKTDRRQMAVVMDEYGGVEGLVTLEDIVEEIFGEFVDETDKELIPIKNDGDSYIVQSSVSMDDLVETLRVSWDDIGLDESVYGGETIGYTITSELERFPENNEMIYWQTDDGHTGLSIQVSNADENTIHEVIVKVL